MLCKSINTLHSLLEILILTKNLLCAGVNFIENFPTLDPLLKIVEQLKKIKEQFKLKKEGN